MEKGKDKKTTQHSFTLTFEYTPTDSGGITGGHAGVEVSSSNNKPPVTLTHKFTLTETIPNKQEKKKE